MKINFITLKKDHFPLLLKWLKTPHVRKWWDQDIAWTAELIAEKYGSYVEGYKAVGDIQKPVHAYIIKCDNVAIGYIQYYNAYDFEREEPLENLPQSLAAFDIFIGDPNYIGKGIGTKVLKLFYEQYIMHEFENCLEPVVKLTSPTS